MKRRNKGEILKILLDEKASKDNTICLNSYGNGIIDAITFIDKDTEYPQKDKLGELIEWLRTTDMVSITMEDILAKAKEIKNK